MGRLVRDLVIAFFSTLLAIILVQTGIIEGWVKSFPGSFLITSVLITSFFAGILYSSFFTSSIAVAVFIVLGVDGFNPLVVAVLGGIGSLCTDLLIFKFVRTNIFSDLKFVDKKLAKGFFSRLFLRKPFHFLTVILGMIIIASPLPDELGVGLLAASKLNVRNFIILSYVLNTIGIFLITLLGRAF